MTLWLVRVGFIGRADKAISPYAVQTYPKRLQGGLVPLSPAAAGAKVLTSVREPNANGWCLWASGTLKVLTQLFRQPCNVTDSLSVYQLITAGRTVTESVQAPCQLL